MTNKRDGDVTVGTSTMIVPNKRRISTRRQLTDIPVFNGLSVRAQKIVRRIAFGDELIYSEFTKTWVLVNRQDAPYTRCKVKAKDAINISFMANVNPIPFHIMLADVRRHFYETLAGRRALDTAVRS